jgi:hypothetical protein
VYVNAEDMLEVVKFANGVSVFLVFDFRAVAYVVQATAPSTYPMAHSWEQIVADAGRG